MTVSVAEGSATVLLPAVEARSKRANSARVLCAAPGAERGRPRIDHPILGNDPLSNTAAICRYRGCREWALFGPRAMSDFSPQCAQKGATTTATAATKYRRDSAAFS